MPARLDMITLRALFTDPVSGDIPFAGIETLFIALGATVAEERGSRVKFDKDEITAAFHRPHNPKTARAYQMEPAREFLIKAGVRP